MLNIAIIRDMQIKTTTRGHLAPVSKGIIKNWQWINGGEGMEKRKSIYGVGGL